MSKTHPLSLPPGVRVSFIVYYPHIIMKLIKRHLYKFFVFFVFFCVSLSHSSLMDDAIENLVHFLPEMMSLQRLKYDMHIFMCFYHVNG